jgi:hypothetical protein
MELRATWSGIAIVRFMFDYLHGDVAKQISATNAGNACVYRELKLGRGGGEVRQGWRAI